MNAITFGKYKGMPVTRILRINPSYFGWCKDFLSEVIDDSFYDYLGAELIDYN